MNRTEFLAEVWLPYPEANPGWLDVASFSGAPAVVCGRFDDGLLTSGGKSIFVQIEEGAQWLIPQKHPVKFHHSWIADGDLVALSLKRQEDGGWVADRLLLLAPTQQEYSISMKPEVSTAWGKFTREVRGFFSAQGFTEAFTPTLVPSPGTEPYLDPFRTEWEYGRQTTEFFLPTSPEFHLKKMLVAGWTRLFEIKTCFRNGEVSRNHQPEFHMLEWYRAYANLDAIADDVEGLIATLARRLRPEIEVPKLERTTIAELFAQAFPGFVLRPETTREDLMQLARLHQVDVSPTDSFDDVFFRLFLEKIEMTLGENGPLLVRGYPPSQAALSRIGRDGFADRFEVYWRGLELANAFHELNDPAENERRFEADQARKREIGKPAVPVDSELVKALYHGLPPSGGIALGLERLFMALYEIETIAETRAFPITFPD